MNIKPRLRQASGFLRSILSWMGLNLEAPGHTTLARRGQRLDVDLCQILPWSRSTWCDLRRGPDRRKCWRCEDRP
ncbi:MAG: transposase [Myxococcota bacterium]